jgi:integrase
MIKTIGTIRFNLRVDKILKDGKAPIELIYSISQQRKYYNTGLKIFEPYWNTKTQYANYFGTRDAKKLLPNVSTNDLLTEIEINDINASLSKIVADIDNIEKSFKISGTLFTSQLVIEALKEKIGKTTKKEEPNNFLFDFMDKYIQDHLTLREKGSLSVYRSVKKHLLAYQTATKHKVTFETIDYNFFNKLNIFLINRTKTDKAGNVSSMLNNTTIAKALSTLKTFLGYARKQGIKVNDSYKDYSIKKEKLEVIALDQTELNALISFDLNHSKRLDRVRDIFVFSCASGLRYSDVALLKREHIKENVINLVIKKTKTELSIPLNSITQTILNKYEAEHKILPIVSNQELNRCLKELCKMVGIDSPIEIVRFYGAKREVITYPKYELIHFHTARKTFCTLSLEKGMSAEVVMKISGHQTYNSFKRYINITKKVTKVEMAKHWGEATPLRIVS